MSQSTTFFLGTAKRNRVKQSSFHESLAPEIGIQKKTKR
jgi:hypothetical protein